MRIKVALLVLLIAALTVLAALGIAGQYFSKKSSPASTSPDAVSVFLAQHWKHPMAAQGMPPAHFSDLEKSLDPAACGACHTQQYADWQNSLHSQTMSAGIMWQLHLMPQADANSCLNCHAPLAEQKALLAQTFKWPNAPTTAPPSHIPENLGHQGLVCAACHVRGNERFGPEPKKPIDSSAALPHDGFVISSAFESSEFCSTCHQFPDDGPRTNGKLREDTYQQWQSTQYAKTGETCQSCHMPDRKHHWQGVHSKDMVNKALHAEFNVIETDGEKRVIATLTNVGAGHHFPTYMVPKVTASVYLNEPAKLPQLLTQHVIGWMVNVGLDQELFDTRLAAGESVTLAASLPVAISSKASVSLIVEVAPREHYERTFDSMESQTHKMSEQVVSLLRQAQREAKATRFEALIIEKPLAP